MAQGYLQTVQQGANKSYQDLVDTASRLGALQEEYKQRQAALEEQQKASLRSGVSQANIVGGTLGWENMKDYYNYASNTGDWMGKSVSAPTITQADVAAKLGLKQAAEGVGPTAYNAGLLQADRNSSIIGNATSKGAILDKYQPTSTNLPIPQNADIAGTTFTEQSGVGVVPINQQTPNNLAAIPVQNTPNSVANTIDSTIPVPAAPISTPTETAAQGAIGPTISNTSTALSGTESTASTATTMDSALKDVLGGSSNLEIAQSAAPTSEVLSEAGAATPGALNTAMSSIGGIAGIGLGAYSAAKTGLSVGNVSSMLGGGLMLGSLMEGFAFLGPWGLGVALAGGIASSIFGW